MRETGRHPQLGEISGAQRHGDMFAPCRRTGTNVDRDVVDCTTQNAHQLALRRRRDLEV
jgi:hypothetical protein